MAEPTAPREDPASTCATDTPSFESRKSRVLFGSCNSQVYEQPLWPILASRNATAFVWGGDAIYADHNAGLIFSSFPPKMIAEPATPETLRRLYGELRDSPGYRSFLESGITAVTGCFDDHDYGINNGDRTYKYKVPSAEAFIEFLGEATDSTMAIRARNGHGAYGVKLLDFDRPVGQEMLLDQEAGLDPDAVSERPSDDIAYSSKSVAIFVLDSRSHKTPWNKGKNKYRLNPEGDFLGERQWRWFEEAISRSRAAVNIVVQGLQVHAHRYPDGNVAEDWSKFPIAQQRLYNALLQENVRAPILVSGDVHHAQLMRKDCQHYQSNNVRPLLEVTTSGMTHGWGTSFCSRPHSMLCKIPYVQFVLRTFITFAHRISPWTEMVIEEDTGQFKYTIELNFAEMELDWDDQTLALKVFGVDETAGPLFQDQWKLEEISGSVPMPGSKVLSEDYQNAGRVLREHGMDQIDWACVNYRGPTPAIQFQMALASSMALPITMLSLPWVALLYLVIRLIRRIRSRDIS